MVEADRAEQAGHRERVDRRQRVEPVTAVPIQGYRILLAEDCEINQELLCTILRRAGADVDIVGDGQAAVEAALGAQTQEQLTGQRAYDVILMDVQMPAMDGLQATRLLRGAGYSKPIIALTAHAMLEDRVRCCEAGCNDHTTKPINGGELFAMILKYAPERTRIEVQQDSIEAKPVECDSATIRQCDDASAASPAQSAAQSAAGMLVSSRLSEPGMVQLVSRFIGRLSDRITAFREAIAQRDIEALANLAHKLKGAAGGYGFAPISEAAAALEQSAQDRAELAILERQVEALVELCRRAGAGEASASHPQSQTT